MSGYIQYETLLFIRSVGLGAVLVIVYGMLCAFRKTVKHSKTAVAAEDLLYWCGTGIVAFISAYMGNQGNMRSFLLLGLILGAWLCFLTVGHFFFLLWLKLFGIPVYVVKKIIKWLLFMGGRGKILVYKIAAPVFRWRNNRFLQAKRSKQVEKVKKEK